MKQLLSSQPEQILKLKGPTVVIVDWANVHGWEEKLRWEIDLKKLYRYLKSYPQIQEFRFYFGTDAHPASKQQLKQAQEIGFKVITKTVKYLPIKDKNIVIWKRKCDFDLEIGLDCFEMLEKFAGFIFFSGDGDFAALYRRLVKRKKQVIVVATKWSLGKEITQIKRGVYILRVNKLKSFIKKSPRLKNRGCD
ncbi:MAG: NYN domain-containing protein [Microgenomates group bacterium]